VKANDKFEPADLHHFRAAEGWFELGDMVSANDELDEIRPEMRAHPVVLSMRYEIYAEAKKWAMAAEVAGALVKLVPDQAAFWISYAYSTRRKADNGIYEAREILLEAEQKFPGEYMIKFNLACYYSQLHEFAESGSWLKKAMAIEEKKVQELAVDDPDLKPLWDSMNGTLWKRE